jgi:hypothetical protein
MTPIQFTAWAEAVFGKYSPAMKLEVEGWLDEYSDEWIDALRLVALEECPSTYRIPPGVHEIVEIRKMVPKAMNRIANERAPRIEADPNESNLIERPSSDQFKAAWNKITALARAKKGEGK